MMHNALFSINNQLNWQEVPTVPCPEGFVRIKVVAAGLNRADVQQRYGKYPPPEGVTSVLGLECAGIIVEAKQSNHWQVGDKVCALVAGGAIATELLVDARHLFPIPSNFSFVEAAALPEVYTTAWLNLFQLANLQQHEKVLLHAGASGVGSAAIQLCKAFNNPCYVTVGSQDKLDYCLKLGATAGVIRSENLESIAEFAPFDVILDPVGASYTALNSQILAMDARWIIIAMLGGHKAELNLAQVLAKRAQIIGSTLRNRSVDFKTKLIQDITQRVWPFFENNTLSACVTNTFTIDHVDEAFDYLEKNQSQGKTVIIIDPDYCSAAPASK